MSEALMGPTYSMRIEWKDKLQGAAVVEALSGKKVAGGIEVNESLSEELFARFRAMVERLVQQFKLEHDGYSVESDSAHLFYDPKEMPDEVAVSIGINVKIKEDDFDAFETLLQTDPFVSEARDLIQDSVLNCLTRASVNLTGLVTTIEESEFGYG